jgi:hypothetical protein
MRANEKQMMIEAYENEFKHLLALENMKMDTDRQKAIIMGQKSMLKLFFSAKEINTIENKIRVNGNGYLTDRFENIESWLRTIEKDMGEKEILFTWDIEGVENVTNHYDWLMNDEKYRGLFLTLNMTMESLEKRAA